MSTRPSQIKLDLSNIPEIIREAKKFQKEKLKGPDKSVRRLTNLFTNDPETFFDLLSEGSSVPIPETSSASEKLARQLSQLKM